MGKSINFESDNIVCSFLKKDIPHGFGYFQSKKVCIFTSDQKYQQALVISDLQDKFDVTINWKKVIMEKKTEQFTIEVSYNSKSIEELKLEVQVNYPLLQPELNINPQQITSLKWGDAECLLLYITYGSPNIESWKYNVQQCDVKIEVVSEGFSVSDNKFSLNVCQSKKISFTYKYSGCINKSKELELKIKVNGNEHSYTATFDPLPPQLIVEREMVLKSVALGMGYVHVCSVSVKKQSEFAADIVKARLDIDCRIKNLFTLKIPSNNQWFVYFNSSHVRSLPIEPISVSLSVSSKNVGTMSVEGFQLTKDNQRVDGENNDEVRLELHENSLQIVPRQAILYRDLYETSDYSQVDFSIKNNGDSRISNIQIDLMESKGYICCANNQNRFTIKSLGEHSERQFQINARVRDNTLLTLEVRIQVRADYLKTKEIDLTLPVKNKRAANLLIKPIEGTAETIFFDEAYNNRLCLKLSLSNVIEPDTDVRGVSKLYLNDITFCAPFSINSHGVDALNPGKSCICDLVLSGSIHKLDMADAGYRVSCTYMESSNNEILVNAVEKVYRRFDFQIEALAPTFPLPNEDGIIKIAKLLVKEYNLEATEQMKNQRIIVDAPFCFDGNTHVKEKQISLENPIYIYIDTSAQFGKAVNIEDNQSIVVFKFNYSDDVPGQYFSKKVDLTLRPLDLSARLNIYLEDENDDKQLDENGCNQVEVFYTRDELNGTERNLGTLVIENETQLVWHNESVIVRDARIGIVSEESEQLVDLSNGGNENIGDVIIYNGDEAMRFPVVLDIEKWKTCNMPKKLTIVLESGANKIFTTSIVMHEIVNDDIYALDLGTTGIVMAKEHEGEIGLVSLRDQESKNFRIEKDDEILSSIIIKKHAQGEENDILELAPKTTDYFGKNDNVVLVPSKFIIGQNHIPFLGLTIENTTLNAFGKENIDLANNNATDSIIGCLYKHIFSLIPDEENNNVRKLVATYPNTYTPDNIDKVRNIIQQSLDLTPENVAFVPESDAVAAYYFDKRINSNDPFNEEDEKILIYDMGAGTLDVSVVKIHSGENKVVASIENKIGIPVAGNYLDYLLYKSMEESGLLKDEAVIQENGKVMKKLITSFKKAFPDFNDKTQKVIIDESFNQEYQKFLNGEICNKTYNDVFGEKINKYLEICTEKVFNLLNINQVDRIVFSGRASQFSPIRNRVVNHFGGIGHVKVEKLEQLGGNLKTCVAIGALKYQQYFNNNNFYAIENRNQYAKIGVVYYQMNENHTQNQVAYKILIDPSTGTWDNAELVNGTRYKVFNYDGELTNVVNNTYVYYIQSMLDEQDIINLYNDIFSGLQDARHDILWGLVNELFRVRINSRSGGVTIQLSIDRNNIITQRRIGNTIFANVPVVENIENNYLYRNSMWPFI